MRTLVVAATSMEVAPVAARIGAASPGGPRVEGYVHRSREIDVLVTGVGMVAASAWTSRALAERSYDVALNVGICGSFDRTLTPGTVVNVVSDRVSELGAEDGPAFLTIDDLDLAGDGLPGPTVCVAAAPPDNQALAALPAAIGITVNTVHGRDDSIAAVIARFHPQVESMEGAGFMFACAIQGLWFAQVRAVSNFVERRNRQAWRIPQAIDALAPVVVRILETL